METLMLPFSPRFIVLTICGVVTVLLLGIGVLDANPKVWELILLPIVIFGALTLLGIRDLTQKGHAVLRNYPISAHIRFLLEEIRPEMRLAMAMSGCTIRWRRSLVPSSNFASSSAGPTAPSRIRHPSSTSRQ